MIHYSVMGEYGVGLGVDGAGLAALLRAAWPGVAVERGGGGCGLEWDLDAVSGCLWLAPEHIRLWGEPAAVAGMAAWLSGALPARGALFLEADGEDMNVLDMRAAGAAGIRRYVAEAAW